MSEMYNNISDEAVERATGKTWDEWFALLDAEGAEEMPHRDIATFLIEDGHIAESDGWWAQAVTVGYEYAKGRRVKGETKDAGFQVGVQKTMPLSSVAAWELLLSPEAVRIWLGADVGDLSIEPGETATSSEGHAVEIRTVKEGERVRLRWQPPGRSEPTTLQVYLQDKGAKTAVRFHQEKLAGPDERARMKQHWRNVLKRLHALIGS